MRLKSKVTSIKISPYSRLVLSVLIYCFALLGSCLGQTTIEKEIAFEGFSFKLSETNSKINITLDAKQGPLKTHSEIVPNPNRFLIDVLGTPSKTARSIDLNGQMISRIRVGIHKDKTRIVIDLKDNLKDLKDQKEDKSDPNMAIYKYLFSVNASAVNIHSVEEISPTIEPTSIPAPTLEVQKKKEETLVDLTDAEATPQASSNKIEPELPKNLAKVEEQKLPEIITDIKKNEEVISVPSQEPSKVAKIVVSPPEVKLEEKPVKSATPIGEIDQAILDIEKSKLIKKNILKNLVFQTTSEKIQSTIAISLSEIGSYELKQISESKYILELPDTRLRAKHLSLPQYPPDSFKGFVYIQAEETESSSLVIIVIDPGVLLSAEVSQGKLWIKSK